jgi:hypothetical protein
MGLAGAKHEQTQPNQPEAQATRHIIGKIHISNMGFQCKF